METAPIAGGPGQEEPESGAHALPADSPGPAPAGPEVEAAVPQGAAFKGLLIVRGEIRVEGEVTGEIESQGSLHLGETSRVKARVCADELTIAGDFEGDASARSRIALHPTARVRGTLAAPRIALADGCLFLGRCQSGEPRSASGPGGSTTPRSPSGDPG